MNSLYLMKKSLDQVHSAFISQGEAGQPAASEGRKHMCSQRETWHGSKDRKVEIHTFWLSFTLIILLLFLASCINTSTQTERPVKPRSTCNTCQPTHTYN